jgi:hypothetical protein
MAQDPRYRTKLWLDTYLSNANLLKDDGTTQVTFITAFQDPPYPMERVFFLSKDVDLVYSIDQPTSTPGGVDWDGTTYKYREVVPVTPQTVTKQGINGNKLLWQAEAELRRVAETYPLSSYRNIARTGPPQIRDMGGWRLFQITYQVTYERDTT